MKMISSKAGTRLAKAKAAVDHMDQHGTDSEFAYHDAIIELEVAARAVADELIADGHHLQEGD